jgi:hypothetical protein
MAKMKPLQTEIINYRVETSYKAKKVTARLKQIAFLEEMYSCTNDVGKRMKIKGQISALHREIDDLNNNRQ